MKRWLFVRRVEPFPRNEFPTHVDLWCERENHGAWVRLTLEEMGKRFMTFNPWEIKQCIVHCEFDPDHSDKAKLLRVARPPEDFDE